MDIVIRIILMGADVAVAAASKCLILAPIQFSCFLFFELFEGGRRRLSAGVYWQKLLNWAE